MACAGSGKTSRVVNQAVGATGKRIAIVTYTNNNVREIEDRLDRTNSGTPPKVDVMTWFAFLLRECARPYQSAKYATHRISSLLFVNKRSAMYVPEREVWRHYFADGDLIYSDKISQFVVKCDEETAGAVIRRLERIYSHIFIDEFQDLAGYDLDIVDLLLRSRIDVTLVGDPRQHIYSTNPASKNKQFLGVAVVDLIENWRDAGLCDVEYLNETFRCGPAICELSNSLWPDLEPMVPAGARERVPYEGVLAVSKSHLADYIDRFRPQILRYSKRSKTFSHHALNFGMAKGLQFNRVLIIPTRPIRKFIESGDLRHVEKSRDKLHVAITRARHSVAFLYGGKIGIAADRWSP